MWAEWEELRQVVHAGVLQQGDERRRRRRFWNTFEDGEGSLGGSSKKNFTPRICRRFWNPGSDEDQRSCAGLGP
jgi:hypothetical protein